MSVCLLVIDPEYYPGANLIFCRQVILKTGGSDSAVNFRSRECGTIDSLLIESQCCNLKSLGPKLYLKPVKSALSLHTPEPHY